jgi:hypothetical protein|tara:strand:+ start:465 stop:839 length:375 start_codon:yes stop_codon:yes gene_type:complete
MAFKLGGENRKSNYGTTKNRFDRDDASVPGVPVIRKKLAKGIMGEANIDGSIFISDKVEPGSAEERKILMHEMGHMVDMKTGKLSYTDDSITWMGEDFDREKGMIKFEGKWLPEGDTSFPWEKH